MPEQTLCACKGPRVMACSSKSRSGLIFKMQMHKAGCDAVALPRLQDLTSHMHQEVTLAVIIMHDVRQEISGISNVQHGWSHVPIYSFVKTCTQHEALLHHWGSKFQACVAHALCSDPCLAHA